jgi:hypothetical protein
MSIPHNVAMQRLGKHVLAAITTRATIEEFLGRIVFFAVRVLLKESLWVCVSLYRCYVTIR